MKKLLAIKEYQQSNSYKDAQKKYFKSEKGKAAIKKGVAKYRKTKKGKLIFETYKKSDEFKEVRKKYLKSDKGRAMMKKARKKWYDKNYQKLEVKEKFKIASRKTFKKRYQNDPTFRILIKISGVGPKLAIGVLSGLSGDELASAVERDDVATLTRLPGIGKKTAERLIVELRGRMTSSETSIVNHAASPIEEAVLGLIALGYKETEARKAIDRLPNDSEATPENLIRASLKQMLRQP